MPDKTPAQKAHVKPGTSVSVLDPAPGVVEAVGLPADTAFVEPEGAGLVFVFVRTKADLESAMRPAARRMSKDASLWVFYRKGSKDAGFDVNRDDVWAMAGSLGMRPLGLVSIDESWSAFRLKHGSA